MIMTNKPLILPSRKSRRKKKRRNKLKRLILWVKMLKVKKKAC